MRIRSGWMAAAAVGAGLWSVVAWGGMITWDGTTVDMLFVDIGSAGNTADTTGSPNPCGAVAYDYRIGTYEVSATQWGLVNTAAGIGNTGYWAGSQPVASISWNNAAMFCNWLTTGNGTTGYYTLVSGSGGSAVFSVNALSHADYAAANGTAYFLPTEDEWYKAAYYDPALNDGAGGYWDYPTGRNWAPGAVSGGTAANTAVYNGQTDPANIYNSGGLSPFLTMGQGGNVWEWNETLIGGSNRGRRGGAYQSGDYFLSAADRSSSDPTLESPLLGFRVASMSVVPEPGSLGLLAFAGLLGLKRRKRVRQ